MHAACCLTRILQTPAEQEGRLSFWQFDSKRRRKTQRWHGKRKEGICGRLWFYAVTNVVNIKPTNCSIANPRSMDCSWTGINTRLDFCADLLSVYSCWMKQCLLTALITFSWGEMTLLTRFIWAFVPSCLTCQLMAPLWWGNNKEKYPGRKSGGGI